MSEDRKCKCCGVSEQFEMLAYHGTDLVCQECHHKAEREWVAESPIERRHYLDTFNPAREGRA